MSKDAHYLRSRILNYAILVEIELENFIKNYFINKEDKKEEFGDLVLSKEFFTFEQKIRIFQKIIKKGVFKITNDLGDKYVGGENKLIKDIEYIQEVRNAVAHIHPFRDQKTGEITIKYKHKKKEKEIIFNDIFDKQFFYLFDNVFMILRYKLKERKA